jgi:hypothetical protein
MDALGGVLTKTPRLSIIVQKRNCGAQYRRRPPRASVRADLFMSRASAASHTLIAGRPHRSSSERTRTHARFTPPIVDPAPGTASVAPRLRHRRLSSGGEFTMK